MSLINQMLRDLDARHAPTLDRVALPAEVHALQQDRRGPRLQVPALLIASAAIAAAWLWATWREPPPPPLAVVLPAASPAPAPAPQPQAATPAEPAREPQPASASGDDPAPAPAAVAPQPPDDAPAADSSALADELPRARGSKTLAVAKSDSGRIASPRNAAPAKESGVMAKAADRVAAAAPTPPPAEASSTAKDTAAPADPGSIDKRPRPGATSDAAAEAYRQAMAALRRGAIAEAQDGLRATLRHDARHISARQALLSLLVEQQKWVEGQALMEEGLALDPSQVGWTIALARLQLETGKLVNAAETLTNHARYAEHNADYQGFHALLLQKLKRPREAAERYRAALALRPAEARWWYGLGLALDADQKPQEALDAFRRARDVGSLPQELSSALEQRLR